MAENSMKPRIRFKGYTDAWEQRKAETLFISYAEKGYPELPVLSATQDKGMVYRDDTGKNIFHDKSNEIGYKRVQPGQFVIHLRSFQGGFAHSAILGITSPAYTIFGVKEGEKQYDLYWKCVFSSPKFVKRLETVTYGIRDGRNISYDEFLTMDFLVPKYEEQLEIADSLVKIDNLITLHQRKYDKIVNIKKALLEKMFPSDAETTPKIRFKGFTDAWEQRKLREVFDYERPDTYIVKSDKYSDTYSTPVLTANKGFILGYTNEMQVCNKECIIFDDFTLDSKYVTFPFMVKSSALKILTAKIGYFLPFAYQLLQATNIEILGHARHYISVVQPTKVLIPSNDEQIRIGKCIQQIDNLITLHQRQLEKLKNIKSALLEKMFV